MSPSLRFASRLILFRVQLYSVGRLFASDAAPVVDCTGLKRPILVRPAGCAAGPHSSRLVPASIFTALTGQPRAAAPRLGTPSVLALMPEMRRAFFCGAPRSGNCLGAPSAIRPLGRNAVEKGAIIVTGQRSRVPERPIAAHRERSLSDCHQYRNLNTNDGLAAQSDLKTDRPFFHQRYLPQGRQRVPARHLDSRDSLYRCVRGAVRSVSRCVEPNRPLRRTAGRR